MQITVACRMVPYAKYSFERALAGVAAAGYRFVSFGNPTHQGVDVLAEPMTAESLQSMLGRQGLTPIMLTGTSEFAVSQPLERALRRLDLAADLGVREVLSNGLCRLGPSGRDPVPDSALREDRQVFVEKYQKLAKEAQSRGVTITLKPHSGITATARHVAALIADIAAPNVKASYDPGNVQYYTGVRADVDLPHVIGDIYSLVAKDHRGEAFNPDFPLPGEGDVDFPSLLRQLAEAEFSGPIYVERVDGNPGAQLSADDIDQRVGQARQNLERLLSDQNLAFIPSASAEGTDSE